MNFLAFLELALLASTLAFGIAGFQIAFSFLAVDVDGTSDRQIDCRRSSEAETFAYFCEIQLVNVENAF